MNCTGPECDRDAKHPSTGLCGSHQSQIYRGVGLTPLINRSRKNTEALFLAGVEATDGPCVLGPTKARPLTSQSKASDRRTTLAKAVWEAVHGAITDGRYVLHWCQNDTCVNVRHLYLGTAKENTADFKAIYEIGRAIVAARVQKGGAGYSRGVECAAPPRE